MDNIFPSPSEETILIALVFLSDNTLKDDFFNIGGNVGNLPNHRSPTEDTWIIWQLNM